MPRIPQIMLDSLPQGELNTQRANPSQFGVGQGIANLGEGLARGSEAVYKSEEQKETSSVAVQLAQAKAQYSSYLDDLVKQGNLDPADYGQKLQDHLSQIGDGISTGAAQEYYAKTSGVMTAELQADAHKAASDLAGEQAVNSYSQMLNTYSSNAISAPDSFQGNLEAVNNYLELQTPNIGEKNVLKLKLEAQEKLALSAAEGRIRSNPEQASKDIMDGHFDEYVSGEKKEQLLKRAHEQIRSNRTDAALQLRELNKQRKEAADASMQDALNSLVKGNLKTSDILQNPYLTASQKHNVLSWAHVDVTNPIQTDRTVFNQIQKRVFADDADPDKIVNREQIYSYINKGLAPADAKKLSRFIEDQKTPDGSLEHRLKSQAFNTAVAAFKSSRGYGANDPVVEQQKMTFAINFDQALESGRKQGKSVQSMLNPASKDYIVKDVVNSTMLTPSQLYELRVKDLTKTPGPLNQPQATPGAGPLAAPDPSAPKLVPNQSTTTTPKKEKPKRLPGESIPAYLKRIGEF